MQKMMIAKLAFLAGVIMLGLILLLYLRDTSRIRSNTLDLIYPPTFTLASTAVFDYSQPTLTPSPYPIYASEHEVTPVKSTPTPTSNFLPEEGIPFSIGLSVNNRDLWVTRYGHGPVSRLIVGAIHGGYEWNTVDLINQLEIDIENGEIAIPPEITLYLLPNLNPDGYYDHFGQYVGRPNANGVDLNRNWDSNWQPTWPLAGCFQRVPVHGGAYPFSEPETLALANFLLDYKIDALISYHSQMGAIFATGDDSLYPPADDLALTLASASGYQYPPPDTGCVYTGQLVDWSVDQGIAAVTVELYTHDGVDLDINRKLMVAFLNWKRSYHPPAQPGLPHAIRLE